MGAAALGAVGAGLGHLRDKAKRREAFRSLHSMSSIEDRIIAFARTATELLKTRRVPWKMTKTGYGSEVRYAPTAKSMPNAAHREANAGYTDTVQDARDSVAANIKRSRMAIRTKVYPGMTFSALTPGMITLGK